MSSKWSIIISLFLISKLSLSSSIDSELDQETDDDVVEIGPPSPSKAPKSTSKKPTFNPRSQEIVEFFEKLRREYRKLETTHEFNLDQLEKLLGHGQHLIVFDCKRPGYLDLRRKAQIKSPEVMDQLRSWANCSTSDNIWLTNGDLYSPATYNHMTKTISRPPLPFRELITYFNRLDLCHDLMRFLRHPGYFTRSYRKPLVCSSKKKTTNELMDLEAEDGATNELPKPAEAKFHPQRRRRPQRFRHPGFQQQFNHPQFNQFRFGGFNPMGGCIGG